MAAWRAPRLIEIDLDATLLVAHSDKQGAAGNYKGGFGFHPMLAYLDGCEQALAGLLRPGNAGANTAADKIAVLDAALAQLPKRARRASDPRAGRLGGRDARADRLLSRRAAALLGRL